MRDDAGNWGPWAEMRAFIIDTTPPATPVQVAPIDGEYLDYSIPLFEWSGVPGVASYHLQADDSLAFDTPSIDTEVNHTTFDYVDLNDGTYNWRVRAQDAASNWGSWSDVRNFTIDTIPPGVTVLASPANASTTEDTTPFFGWDVVLSATQYVV